MHTAHAATRRTRRLPRRQPDVHAGAAGRALIMHNGRDWEAFYHISRPCKVDRVLHISRPCRPRRSPTYCRRTSPGSASCAGPAGAPACAPGSRRARPARSVRCLNQAGVSACETIKRETKSRVRTRLISSVVGRFTFRRFFAGGRRCTARWGLASSRTSRVAARPRQRITKLRVV